MKTSIRKPVWPPVLLVALAVVLAGCQTPRYAPPAPEESRTVVVWISIDGVRPDYLTRTNLPFFDRMASEGAFSYALSPIFPSLTFPNHVSQATGVKVEQHGVPLNSFYDQETGLLHTYPGDSSLVQAESIWNVAERQGRRAAVLDWVLSYQQQGEHAASYFNEGYNPDLTDRERISQVLTTWRKDRNEAPLQLLMGYMDLADKAGHEHGPNSPEIARVMQALDAEMERFTRRAVRLFNRRMDPERDVLYLIVTSDHGMSDVHTGVHPLGIAGIYGDEEINGDIVVTSSANLTHIFLHRVEDEQERAGRIIRAASLHDFAEIYRREELPPDWGYAHPARTGDLLLVLPGGYAFGRRTGGLSAPRQEARAPAGMHGYDVQDNPEMNGIALFWRYPEPLGGIDLGPKHCLQLHATVAGLLGIEPAREARQDPIRLE